MDERFIENSEAVIAAEIDSKVTACSKLAFSDRILGPSEFLREDCEDCGNDLIQFRKERGLLKCLGCQREVERRASIFRHNRYTYED